MDSTRVSLVTLVLRADSFGGAFKCDHNMTLGMSLCQKKLFNVFNCDNI